MRGLPGTLRMVMTMVTGMDMTGPIMTRLGIISGMVLRLLRPLVRNVLRPSRILAGLEEVLGECGPCFFEFGPPLVRSLAVGWGA